MYTLSLAFLNSCSAASVVNLEEEEKGEEKGEEEGRRPWKMN
jgi:hypothetical protein